LGSSNENKKQLETKQHMEAKKNTLLQLKSIFPVFSGLRFQVRGEEVIATDV
jgi:hypothetical protein